MPLYHETGGIHKTPINDPKRQNTLRVENTLAQRQERLQTLIKPSFLSLSILIIDEASYLALQRNQANLFRQVIAKRYERCSTILTSNLSFGE